MTPYLPYTVDSLTLELTANCTITHAWMRLIWHTYFLHKIHHSLFAFRTLNSTSALPLGFIWNSEINKKYKTAKNMALIKPQKRLLFTVWKLKQESRSLPCLTSDRTCMLEDWNFSHSAHAHVYEWLTVTRVLVLKLQINFSK